MMLEAALQLAGRGWRIFPCHSAPDGRCSCGKADCVSPGKHPRVRAWQRHATADARQIESWWRKWPDANIGLATGGGVVVLDLDGPAEVDAFATIAKPHGGLPATLVAQTGRGFHIYLTGDWPTTRKVGGLLVRGTGGFVIVPPSLHYTGRRYQWIEQRSIAPMPDWFRDWLQTAGVTKVTANGKGEALGAARLQMALPAHLVERAQRLKAEASSGIVSRSLKTFAEQWSSAEELRVRAALQAIPANCDRDTWLHVGMALHSLGWESGGTGGEGGDRGYELWLEWSQTGGDKFQGEFDCETRWRSFGKRGGVGIGTLFHEAAARGWKEQVSPTAPNGSAAVDFAAAAGKVNGHAVALPLAFSLRFDRDKAGNIKPSAINAREAIKGLELDCRYDTFHERLLVGGQVLEQFAGELSDNTTLRLRTLIHAEFGFDPGTMNCHDAAVQDALEHPFDPICDYLNGLNWDGVPRVERWLSLYLGAEDTALTRAIGRLILIAAVRRVFVPGTKFDQILVLEGPEGRNKSSAIELLAGAQNFSDQSILTVDDRAQQEAVQGVWIYEIADLAGIHRADVERVKAFASRQVDRARPAYGRSRIDKPRRCIFFATTNDSMYLKGMTGNRRFWPVTVGHVDLRALKRDRDQLWAEAVEVERAARSLFLDESLWEAARVEQLARTEMDPWLYILEKIEGKRVEPYGFRVSSRDILDLHLRLPSQALTAGNERRVAALMLKLGWQRTKFWDDGKTVAGYVRYGGKG